MKTIPILLFSLFATLIYGQGVTSAEIAGLITDNNGEPLIGATILAVHEPSGTQYGTATREDGRFNILGVRVGGPYTVTVSYVGYRDYVEKDITMNLGQSLQFNVKMKESTTQ
jgi:hypothetical protein